MITAHYDAMHDRLEARPSLANKVDDTARLNANGEYIRTNYIILFGGAPAETGGDRQARSQIRNDNAVFDYRLRHVGISPEAVRRLIDESNAQLFEWTPIIPGRRCVRMHYPPRQKPEVQVETSVKPPLFYADTEWVLRSFFTNSGY